MDIIFGNFVGFGKVPIVLLVNVCSTVNCTIVSIMFTEKRLYCNAFPFQLCNLLIQFTVFPLFSSLSFFPAFPHCLIFLTFLSCIFSLPFPFVCLFYLSFQPLSFLSIFPSCLSFLLLTFLTGFLPASLSFLPLQLHSNFRSCIFLLLSFLTFRSVFL